MAIPFTKSVLFNDGEQLEPTDLNNAQRYLQALIGDALLAFQTQRMGFRNPATAPSLLGAIGDGGAPFAGFATRQSRNRPGPVFQQVSDAFDPGDPNWMPPNGNDAQVMVYFLAVDEAGFTHAAAVTNPRWDLISIRLAYTNADPQTRDFQDAATRALTTSSFNKQRRVTATITLTQGVEAASPVEPTLPAGHVKLAAFLVSPGMVNFDPRVALRDHRMPLGPVTTIDIMGGQFSDSPAGSRPVDGRLIMANNATANAWCPHAGGAKRLLRVGFAKDNVSGASPIILRLERRRWPVPAGSADILLDLLSIISGGNIDEYREFDVLANAPPVWTNGYSAGFAVEDPAVGVTTSLNMTGISLFVAAPATGLVASGARFVLVG